MEQQDINPAFPHELTARAQWVCYRLIQRAGDPKPTKVPFNPLTGGNARSNDAATWASYEEAITALRGFDGVGFMFSEDDPVVGIDLDNCVADGAIQPWAQEIIGRFNTYAEFSPSGTGIHLIIKGQLPPKGRKKGRVEMYDRGRFFTMTGNRVPGTPDTIAERQDELDRFHAETFGVMEKVQQQPVTPPSGAVAPSLGDADVLRIARNATNGDRFRRLWEGDWQGEFTSQSEADLSLCNTLAFYTGGDQEQTDRLFRQSGLYRSKWDERHYAGGHCYGEEVIQKAIAGRTDFYGPERAAMSAAEYGPEQWGEIAGAIKAAQAGGDPDAEAEAIQQAAHLIAALPEPKRTTRREWLASNAKIGVRVLRAAEQQAEVSTHMEATPLRAEDQVLWGDDEPEKIRRPITILRSETVAAASLPVSAPGGSVNQLHLITEGRELLTVQQAEERGWQMDMGDADPVQMTKQGVKKILDGHRPDGERLLKELTEVFSHFIAFGTLPPLTEARLAFVLALSVLVSYFTEAFPAIFYLHFIGPWGSGKSKAQKIHADLSFNGRWVESGTSLAAARRTAAAGGVLAIDDSEKLSKKESPDMYSLVLSGYKRGAEVLLVEEDGQGNKRVRGIPVYGMRTFSAIREFEDTLRSRLIPIPLVRTDGPQANRTPGIGPSPFRDFSEIKDDAVAFALPRLREAATVYAQLAQEGQFTGRTFELTGPLLTVALMIGGDTLRAEVAETLEALLALREEQGTEAREVPVLRALLHLVGEHKEPVKVTAGQVRDRIEEDDPDNATYADGNPVYSPKLVGNIIRNLRIAATKRTGQRREFIIHPAQLRERADVFGGAGRILNEAEPQVPSPPSLRLVSSPVAQSAGDDGEDCGDHDDESARLLDKYPVKDGRGDFTREGVAL